MSTMVLTPTVGLGGVRRGRPAPAQRPVVRPVSSARVEQAHERPALRLTARGRRLVALLALVLALGTILLGSQQASAGGSPRALEVVAYTVAPGETLWSIAASVAGPGEDVRDVIAELERLNGLGGAGLQAGQQLLVPASRA